MIKRRWVLKQEYLDVFGDIVTALVADVITQIGIARGDSIPLTSEEIKKNTTFAPEPEVVDALKKLQAFSAIIVADGLVQMSIKRMEDLIGDLTEDKLGNAILPNVPIAPPRPEKKPIMSIDDAGMSDKVKEVTAYFMKKAGLTYMEANDYKLAVNWTSVVEYWLESADGDVVKAKQAVREAVRTHLGKGWTIVSPKSINYLMAGSVKVAQKGVSAR